MSNPFDHLLVLGAAWVLQGCAVWAALLLVAAGVEAVSAGRVRATRWLPCPAAVRRGLLVLVGAAAVATTAGGPVSATDWGTPDARTLSSALPVPDRPNGGASHRTGPPTRGAPSGHRVFRVVVRAGDSLWGLLDERLPRADDGTIAGAVAATYRRNRLVIGPDPDHIEAGQRLVLPLQHPAPAPPAATRSHQSREDR